MKHTEARRAPTHRFPPSGQVGRVMGGLRGDSDAGPLTGGFTTAAVGSSGLISERSGRDAGDALAVLAHGPMPLPAYARLAPTA